MDLEELNTETQKLSKLPLNSYFYQANFDLFPGYKEKVSKPMDYSIILKKIQDKEYKTTFEWYNDVVLIYDNAITYHTLNSIWGQIASYCKKNFEKKYFTKKWTTQQEWYDNLTLSIQELRNIIAKSPVPQGIDPYLDTIIEKAMSLPPAQPKLIGEAMNVLNRRASESHIRWALIHILKKTQPNFVELDDLMIKAETLCDHALNSLILYAQTFMLTK